MLKVDGQLYQRVNKLKILDHMLKMLNWDV